MTEPDQRIWIGVKTVTHKGIKYACGRKNLLRCRREAAFRRVRTAQGRGRSYPPESAWPLELHAAAQRRWRYVGDCFQGQGGRRRELESRARMDQEKCLDYPSEPARCHG